MMSQGFNLFMVLETSHVYLPSLRMIQLLWYTVSSISFTNPQMERSCMYFGTRSQPYFLRSMGLRTNMIMIKNHSANRTAQIGYLGTIILNDLCTHYTYDFFKSVSDNELLKCITHFISLKWPKPRECPSSVIIQCNNKNWILIHKSNAPWYSLYPKHSFRSFNNFQTKSN